jgi:RNA recognition motif-containing protein
VDLLPISGSVRDEQKMSMKLFVGGLSWDTNDAALRQEFGRFGNIEEAVVIADRETGRSRGFGFVTFTEASAGQQAIQEMNGAMIDGRAIVANEAQERPRRGGGGGGGGGGGFGGGGGGGGGGGPRRGGGGGGSKRRGDRSERW